MKKLLVIGCLSVASVSLFAFADYEWLNPFIAPGEEVVVPSPDAMQDPNLLQLTDAQRTQIKTIMDKQGIIVDITCDAKGALTQFALESMQTQTKALRMIGRDEDTYEYNLDIKNCTMYANTNRMIYEKERMMNNNEPLYMNDAQALALAKKFIEEKKLLTTVPYTVGDPIVIEKYNNGGGMYIDAPVIEVEETVGENQELKYNSFNILYPFAIGTMKLYQGGSPMGLTIRVENGKIMDFSISLLRITAKRAKAEEITADEALKFVDKNIRNYANSYYAGQKITIDAVEELLSLEYFYDPSTGVEHRYLASAVALRINKDTMQGRGRWPVAFIIPEYSFLMQESATRYGY